LEKDALGVYRTSDRGTVKRADRRYFWKENNVDVLKKHLSQVVEGINLVDGGEYREILEALKLVRRRKGVVYTMGNGGSSALASHFSNDLVKMGRVKSVCLNDMVPTMMAYGNDEGWELMLMKPLSKLMGEEGMAFGISCSGNSENVVNAMAWAHGRDYLTAALTGCSQDSAIHHVAGSIFHARVPDIRVQEDLHTVICHALARGLQEV